MTERDLRAWPVLIDYGAYALPDQNRVFYRCYVSAEGVVSFRDLANRLIVVNPTHIVSSGDVSGFNRSNLPRPFSEVLSHIFEVGADCFGVRKEIEAGSGNREVYTWFKIDDDFDFVRRINS